jgi:hypothetical protein
MVCPTCRKFVGWHESRKCDVCGGDLFIVPRNWSPPKRRNSRAWKRIAKGEVLWDRRRVRRNPPPAAYYKDNWVKVPGHKKGQHKHYLGSYVPSSQGPDADLGG